MYTLQYHTQFSNVSLITSGDPPATKATATPVCAPAADFAIGGQVTISCAITNTATDNVITYQYYFNGVLIAGGGTVYLSQQLRDNNVFETDPELTVVYGSMGSDFNPLGTYQCAATSLWGSTNSTVVFSVCSEFGHWG